MRIGYVTQWFDPEIGSSALPGIVARAMRDAGNDVEVLTGFPNYPTGKIYDGYRLRPYLRERRDGILVHRTALYPSHDTRALTRMANYLSWMVTASVGAHVLRKRDAVLVHLTPVTAGLPAWVLKQIRKVPYVVQVQDLWPDTVTSSGFVSPTVSKTMEFFLHPFCDMIYRNASAIACTSPGMIDKIKARGISEDKLFFAPNWADETAFRPEQKDPALAAELGLRDFTVMYAGNLGEFQCLDTLLHVAERLRDRDDIGFLVMGGGVEEDQLKAYAAEHHLDNVTFIGPQPFAMMATYLALGDLHYIALADLPLFRITLPSKLQATLAAGRPILAGLAGDAARVVEEAGAGVVCETGDVEAMATAIRERADDRDGTRAMGESGRRHYLKHFSRETSLGLLIDLLTRAQRPDTH